MRPTPAPGDEGRPPPPQRAQRCEDLDCGRGFECLHSRRAGRIQARCRRLSNRMGQCVVRDRPGDATGPRPTRLPGATGPRPTRLPGATGPRPTRLPGATGPRPTGRPNATGRPGATGPRPTGHPNATGPRPTGHPNSMGPRPTGRPEGGPELTLNLPDQCVERECCEEERCVMRREFFNRDVAFCEQVSTHTWQQTRISN